MENRRRSSPAPRPSPGAGQGALRVGGRVAVGGVPIDRVDMDGVMEMLRSALVHRRQVQVATVNLDFVVRAQRDRELAGVLRRSELNIADGMPVVWLSQLTGQPAPGRVAGADLAPLLVAEAAAQGAGVFLLGGEHGAAAEAARRLEREHVTLRVDWHEPPRASLQDMDNDRLVERIAASRARVLLVALGNPKQELWIDRHRHRLPDVAIAVGVGCVLDLWADRVRRAPDWMQRAGLEWLHRLIAEPRRLAGRHATGMLWLLVLASRSLLQRARSGGAVSSRA